MERVRNRPAALVALKDERALGHLVASVRRCAGVCLRQTKAARAVRGPQGRMSRLRGAKVLAAARSENESQRTARRALCRRSRDTRNITAELSRGLMSGRGAEVPLRRAQKHSPEPWFQKREELEDGSCSPLRRRFSIRDRRVSMSDCRIVCGLR